VGLGTGHIDFNGAIEVRGAICDGFRVKGGSLRAEEILKADIDIAGDIVVSKGIIGTRIKGGGSVSAKHIHNARIEAGGDVEVEKEIYESTIETRGACKAEGERIVFSSIVAMKGITAKEVGSKTSSPCILTVGVDHMAEREIKTINDRVAKEKEVQSSLQCLADGLRQDLDRLDEALDDLPQQEDRARLQQMALQKKLEGLSEENDPSQSAKMREAIAYLEAKTAQIPETMAKLMHEQNEINERIDAYHNEINASENEIKRLLAEVKDLSGLLQEGKGVPEVKVTDTVFSHTHIIGPHARLITQENYQHVVIREAKISEPDAPSGWEMQISRLK
jgi:uncharacterized protein (DUF342 family)